MKLVLATGILIALALPLFAAERLAGSDHDLVADQGEIVTLEASNFLELRESSSCSWQQVRGPDLMERLTAFQIPTDWGEEYGTRLRGWLLPPATGEYTFWIASDDESELWLSTDTGPSNRDLIASVPYYTAPEEWEAFSTQRSKPLRLEAGKRYYVEALQKEGGGGDHLAVAWQGPGIARQVIAGKHLAATQDGEVGTISREVWTGVAGSRLEDLRSSPKFTGGPQARLEGADSPTATFRAEKPGSYDLRLTVTSQGKSEEITFRVLVTDQFVNGDFELAEGDLPAGWEASGESATLLWQPTGGVADSACARLASEQPASASLLQHLQLAPYTPYTLKGYIRGEGLKGLGRRPATIGVSEWKMENGPEREVSELDWTSFQVDFATGPSGQVDVACKLGSYWEAGSGAVWFDNLTLERNTGTRRFESKYLVLNLYKDEVTEATPEGVEEMLAKVDRMCEAYTELTGYTPGTTKQSAWSTKTHDIEALGWSGNPVLWSASPELMREWRNPDFLAEIFLHEYAHNWDNDRWTFHVHFNELKMYYALEQLDLGIYEDGWTKGPGTLNRWIVRSHSQREQGRCDEVVQEYRNMLLAREVGWEPFKKTYRYFLELPAEEVPKDAWSKFELWHQKLSEFSGQDAFAIYEPGELDFVRAYYAPRPELRELAGIPATQAKVELTDVRWEAAEVGWEEPAYRICGTSANWYPNSIYAHAPSRYVYAPEGKWKRFTSFYALDKGNLGSVVFVVKGDGRELFRSELVTNSDERSCELDLTGVNQLELLVEEGPDGRNSDHGCWFAPTLER